tara:strand:- start:3941 stop:4609 length:669 start_codon:yes stop_codon:yes gene_type:complete
MIKKVSSNLIKNYQVTEAFIQIDYLDGYSYIDRAGEIINKIVRDKKKIPLFDMRLEGLTIKDVDDLIPELKISSNRLWIHFVEPKNLGNIHEKAKKIADEVFEILQPTIFQRVGWRTYFARENSSPKSGPLNSFKNSNGLSDFDIENLVMRREYKEYVLRLEMSPVVKKDNPKQEAVLFDVDLGMKQDDDEEKQIIYTDVLSDIHKELKSEELLESFEEMVG